MMRSLFVLVVLASCCALSASATYTTAPDADDVALMELGIDLAHRVDPSPTYTSLKPLTHEDATIAKFPMLHEIKGLEAKDWSDIQGLLFREPPSAAESSLDMKLDELEAKFNKIDTMPVPSPIAPPGSTLLPSLKKPELGLQGVKAANKPPRLAQVEAKPTPAGPAQSSKAAIRANLKAPVTPAPAVAAAAAPKAAAPAAAKAATKKSGKAASASSSKLVQDTVSTVRLIEKRIKGLGSLFNRLKSQIGLTSDKQLSANARVDKALRAHRKEVADVKKRMAARKSRFAQVDLDSEADAEAETEASTETEHEAVQAVFGEIDSEAEATAETESDAEAESELNADAEAVDEILDSLM